MTLLFCFLKTDSITVFSYSISGIMYHNNYINIYFSIGLTNDTLFILAPCTLPCKKLYVFTQYYASSYIRKYVYRIFARSNA